MEVAFCLFVRLFCKIVGRFTDVIDDDGGRCVLVFPGPVLPFSRLQQIDTTRMPPTKINGVK
jgi:hypothetical protein